MKGISVSSIPSKTSISLIKSTFFNEEKTKKRLADFILNSDRLSMGEECLDFELKFSQKQGRGHTALVNSGSSANLALLQSLINLKRLKRGDKVAFSALTWATNVMPIIQLGLIPVPVDININTLNVTSTNFESVLTLHPDIKGFFLTNILGFCDDLDCIENICRDKGIILIEDNCESFGSVYKGRKLGNYGVASTCSTYVGHHLSTIEGGVVSTDDSELHSMVLMVRAHGWDRSLSEVEQNQIRKQHNIQDFFNLYTFYDLAYNLRPTELTGFLGKIQLETADEIVEIREKNYLKLDETVIRNKRLIPVRGEHMDIVSNFAYPVICQSHQDLYYFRNKCKVLGIEIRPIVGGNMTNQPFYKKYDSYNWYLPNSDYAHNNGFYLPNNPELTEDEIELMIELFSE